MDRRWTEGVVDRWMGIDERIEVDARRDGRTTSDEGKRSAEATVAHKCDDINENQTHRHE